jgi:hypothetical protein
VGFDAKKTFLIRNRASETHTAIWVHRAMKVILKIATLVLFFGTLTTGCRSQIDRQTADKVAQTALGEYSKDEGLTLSKFSTPEVDDNGNSWLYTYRYEGHPRQLVAVLVYKKGGTELSRMLEEEGDPFRNGFAGSRRLPPVTRETLIRLRYCARWISSGRAERQ